MKRIVDVIATKQHGLYFGNRVLLPFHGYLLKIVIDDHILMDFSPSSKEIHVHETEAFMEIYFKDYKNLHDIISKYESIKIVVVEKDKDVFNFENHLKLALRIGENHSLTIEKTDEDILFIE